VCLTLLFEAVSETLLELARTNLKATIGFTGVLQLIGDASGELLVGRRRAPLPLHEPLTDDDGEAGVNRVAPLPGIRGDAGHKIEKRWEVVRMKFRITSIIFDVANVASCLFITPRHRRSRRVETVGSNPTPSANVFSRI